MPDRVRVLHVDDEPGFAELTATHLERANDRFTVETATGAADGLDRLTDEIDCVVSDYEMPGRNGIEFLEAVREEYPDLPFVLFTGKGSEAVASDAISAGVTDYLQKETGTDQYAVLANRVTNAVAQARAEDRLEEERRRFEVLFERLTQPTVEVEYEDGEPIVQQINPAFEEVFGYDASEIVGDSLDAYIIPPARAEEASRINQRVQAGGGIDSLEVRRRTAEGTREFLLQNAVYDDGSGGFAIYTDITDRKRRERELARSRELLRHTEELARTGGWEADGETGQQRWTQGTYAIHDIPPDGEFDPTVERGISFYHADDRPRIEEAVEDCLEAGTPFDEELRLVTAADRHKWVRATGKPDTAEGSSTTVRGAIQDITERKEQEQQLERKNARLSALFERFPEPTLAYAYEDGEPIIRQVNEAFTGTFGYDPEEAVGTHVDRMVVPPGRRESAERIDDRVKSGDSVDEILRRETREGTRHFRFRNIPLPDDDTIDGYAIYADVTERRRREEQLEEEQQRFQTLFEQLTQPLVEVEYDGPDPIVTDVNPVFEEVFGYEASEIVGESLDAYIVPDDHQAEADDINEHVREGGRLVSRSVTRRTADGRREFLLENAVYDDASGGFAIYTDISERKRWEEALGALHDATREFMNAQDRQTVASRAVETARTVLDQPINGLWLHDPAEDVLRPAAMSDDAAELFGDQATYTGGESLSWQAFEDGEFRAYDDVRAEPDRLRAETPVRSEIVVPLGEHGVMNISATEPGAFSEIDVSLARVLGKTVETALTRADREEQLRTQRAELERQNERLEKFTSVVSHDLRNPLQLAAGRVALAQEECDSPHLADAADALDRMDTLIGDLLTIAGGGERVRETDTVALSSVAEECWTLVDPADATLVTATGRTIRADRSRLKQLLENLVHNAAEHGGDGVTVTVGDVDGGFYVADDGPGIPPDEREAVFEIGYSTASSGTGFGVDIVREIAEAHGWDIGLTDSDAGGARFEITGVDIVD